MGRDQRDTFASCSDADVEPVALCTAEDPIEIDTGACLFDGLAAVEVQSIMQMIDRRSLMRLARCSRRMHIDADSDAAWSSQPTFDVRLQDDPAIGSRMQQSLIRHLPDVKVWVDRCDGDPPVDVQAMLTIPRITGIWGRGFGLCAEKWLQVLSHPCTVGLTALMIDDPSLVGALPVELTAQLTRLTRLDTIYIYPDLSHGDLLSVLPTLPALTCLHFDDLSGSIDFLDSLLPPALHACSRLIDIALRRPRDGSRLFRSILSCDVKSPSMAAFLSRLEYLELNGFGWVVPHIPASELSVAFEAMTSLRHLELDSLARVDDLLPFVAHIGGLTELEIWPDLEELERYENGSPFPTSMPTVPALQAMMQSSSVRRVTLFSCNLEAVASDPLYAFDQLDPTRFTLDWC